MAIAACVAHNPGPLSSHLLSPFRGADFKWWRGGGIGQEECSAGRFCNCMAPRFLSWEYAKCVLVSSFPARSPHPGWGQGLDLTQLSAHSQVVDRLSVQSSSAKFSKVNRASCLPAHQTGSGGVFRAPLEWGWAGSPLGPPSFTLDFLGCHDAVGWGWQG